MDVAGESKKQPRKQRGHTTARAPLIGLDQLGRLRVAHLLALLGISHTTLYAGLRTGRYPPPDVNGVEDAPYFVD